MIMLKLVMLHAELMGYTTSFLKELVVIETVSITIVYWDKDRLAPIDIEKLPDIEYIPKSQIDRASLFKLLLDLRPNVVISSGWSDKIYWHSLVKYRRMYSNCLCILALDTQFEYTFRKMGGLIYFRALLGKPFNGCWVAGASQYTYARALGFESTQIANGLYSADLKNFRSSQCNSRRFVYIGRLASTKNVERLIEAYDLLPDSIRRIWPLDVYGTGPLADKLGRKASHFVNFIGYLQPEQLAASISAFGGVFVLPSSYEPWGVVVHEAAAMGMPLLLSSAVGAGSSFLIDGYNGFSFNPYSTRSLSEALSKVATLSIETLACMGTRSAGLAQRITPNLSAYEIVGLIRRHYNYNALLTESGASE